MIPCVAALTSVAAASAEIEGIRTYSNKEKTRVVIDLSAESRYTTAQRDQGQTFILRVKNIDHPSTSPAGAKFSGGSCVKDVTRMLDGEDVRYLFKSDCSSPPRVFALKSQSPDKGFRLVLDFAHSSGNAAGASNLTAGGPINNTSLAAQEHELFLAYSTLGADGMRRMTRKQAAEYDEKLKELRARYAQQQEAASRQDAAPAAKSPPQAVPVKPVNRPFVIAVDAGHGGKDPGAVGTAGVKEKNVTLAIAKALAGYINSNRNFRATLIRSKDVFVDLDKRSEIARQRKADILISIHADSVEQSNSSARGVSVWVLSDARAARENEKVLRDNKQNRLLGGAGQVISSAEQNPYLAATILDMSSSSTRSEGYLLGGEILSSLGKFTRLHKTSPVRASLAVLKSPDIPSLLIETGFLSNKTEEAQLKQANYQKQIAYRIYLGITSYYEKYPARKIESRREAARRTAAAAQIKVKKGDTLGSIAKRYGTTVDALRRANSLTGDNIQIGQTLYIPK